MFFKNSNIKKIEILFLLVVCASFLLPNNRAKQLSINKNFLQNGDLILRRGISAESFIVYTADANSEFSHIGIVLIENNTVNVIHAIPHKNKYVKKERLSEFLNPKNAVKFEVYRANFSEKKMAKVIKNVNEFYKNKVAFDDKYDLNSDDKMYCTELIYKAFYNAHIQLDITSSQLNYIVGKHSVIFPSEFTKYPFKKVQLNNNLN